MNVVSPDALNVVNAPVDAVALPIGVLLIAANCVSPPIMLPEIFNVLPLIPSPVITVPTLPTNALLTLPAVTVVNMVDSPLAVIS